DPPHPTVHGNGRQWYLHQSRKCRLPERGYSRQNNGNDQYIAEYRPPRFHGSACRCPRFLPPPAVPDFVPDDLQFLAGYWNGWWLRMYSTVLWPCALHLGPIRCLLQKSAALW